MLIQTCLSSIRGRPFLRSCDDRKVATRFALSSRSGCNRSSADQLASPFLASSEIHEPMRVDHAGRGVRLQITNHAADAVNSAVIALLESLDAARLSRCDESRIPAHRDRYLSVSEGACTRSARACRNHCSFGLRCIEWRRMASGRDRSSAPSAVPSGSSVRNCRMSHPSEWRATLFRCAHNCEVRTVSDCSCGRSGRSRQRGSSSATKSRMANSEVAGR